MDEIVREGARRMLAAALEAEVNQYIAELADQRDESGRHRHARCLSQKHSGAGEDQAVLLVGDTAGAHLTGSHDVPS
ncbi:hypothetical protein ACFVJ4_36480 [Streptomyces sp. NPDC127178]